MRKMRVSPNIRLRENCAKLCLDNFHDFGGDTQSSRKCFCTSFAHFLMTKEPVRAINDSILEDMLMHSP